jgi:GMP synthase (glutamine-hydrolysing)
VAGVPGEYTLAEVTAQITNARFDPLFHCIEGPMRAWMSRGDRLVKLPEGFHTIATTENSEPAAIAHDTHPIYGVQFHPEVPHTPKGTHLLRNFVVGICGVNACRVPDSCVEQETGRKRKTAKTSSRVSAPVTSGRDAKVAARLSHRFAAVLADYGCLRHDEREQVEKDLNVGAHQDWSVYEAAAILLTLRRSTSGLT